MENEHHEKKLKRDVVLISNKLKIGLYNASLHEVNIVVRSRCKVISIPHQKRSKTLERIKRRTMNIINHL